MAASSGRTLVLFIALVSFHASAAASGVEPLKSSKIRWPKGQIVVSLSSSFLQDSNSVKPGSEVASALARAMSHWEAVADINFELRLSEITSVSSSGPAGDGVSLITIDPNPANLLVFSKVNAKSSAVTRLFFNKQNEIAEADIVLNPTFQFSTDGSFGTFDLERVFTHELGHLLGLRHSILPSSMMFAEVPANALNGITSRQIHLALDDIGNARGLYGSHSEETNCCNVLSGTLQGTGKHGDVVLVDRKTGSVVRSAGTNADGVFEISAIDPGAYDIWYSSTDVVNDMIADQKIDSVTVGKQPSKPLRGVVRPRRISFDISLIGSNGVLAKQPVGLNRGEITRVWVAGRGISAGDIGFGISSPMISVVSTTRISNEFAAEMDVYLIEVDTASNASQGSYNLYVHDASGIRKHLFGVFVVD